MRLSVEDFQKRLRASGLVTDEAVQKLLATLPTDQAPADGEQLARVLVRAELLTAYQAQQIYAGKGSALVLGNYVIQDKLGQGGMGLVLKAVHRRMHRVVALKVLSPDAIKTAGLVERFHREVRAVAKLEHPHIVTAFDADEDRGVHFFVMQYVAGRDLSSIVKSNGPLPADKAVSYLLQAARGLEYAHKQGIVHRDIKPANLLLTNDGVVKILDMGLARIEDAPGDAPSGKADLTATGAVMGTVDYMSPEQALDTKHADARSDIYSLGCTLFYLLTGQPVYSESTMMKRLLAHREAPIPSVSAMLNPGGATPGLLDALDAILQKMLAKRSQDRYQSMTEVVAALSAVSRGETAEILATHSSSGGVSLGGFSGTSVQTMTAGRTAAVAAGLGESETMAVGAMERTLHTIVTSLSEPLGTRHQHARGTNWLLQIGVPMALSLLLAAGLYFAGVFDVAGKNAGNNTAAVTVPTVVPAAKPAEDDVDAGPWAPGADDDRWLGIVPRPAKLEGVTRWQMETVAPRGRSIDLRWSPDGRRFVLASEDQRLRVYRWDGKAIALDHIIPELDGGQTIRMKWSPDNRWLAWQGDFTQDLRTWDTVAKKYGPVMHTGYRTGPAGWSKDGTVFVAASEDGAGAGVFFWEWPSGQLKHAARGHSATPYLVEWSFDQQWLAATDGIDAVRFWKPDGSPGETARIAGCTGISSLSWNPAQSVLAVLYSTAKPSIEAALLQPTDVSQPVVVPVHPGHHHVYVGPLPWTSDGTSLLIQDSVQNNRFQPYDLTGRPGRPGPAIGMSFWTQRPGTGELFLG
ncbi:MAG TPA: serine/threonine-protein kinase, partial [Planctomycetaceae bacterium]|nr:serine/threonine-protein kinase [Planctomycetaceae bacterium]